jgi:hypothetical protein
MSFHWNQNGFIWNLFFWYLFDDLGGVFYACFIPLIDLNFPNEVDPEPYPTAEGKPLTRSQAWSDFRKFLIV